MHIVYSMWNARKYPLTELQVVVDGLVYSIDVLRQVVQQAEAPRLIVVAYQPNLIAQMVLRVCLQTIQRFTAEPYELWVVDNNSPAEYAGWFIEWPNLNVILNHTEPIPPQARSTEPGSQQHGSYANAIALELATRVIDPQSHYLMTLHMDTMPCHRGWLSFLKSKLNEQVRAAGVRRDTVRVPEGILHVLGYLIDFQLFQELKLSFLPDLPDFDVGDLAIINLRRAGYEIFACPNTLWQPELIETIPDDSPLRHLHVDRSFDDDGNVIFLHLGRAILQSQGQAGPRRVSIEEWVEFAGDVLLQSV